MKRPKFLTLSMAVSFVFVLLLLASGTVKSFSISDANGLSISPTPKPGSTRDLGEPVVVQRLDKTSEGALSPSIVAARSVLSPYYTGCGGVYDVPSSNEAYEQEVVELVNAVRAEHGLSPLKRVGSLDDAARYHSTDMGQDNYFNHDSYDQGSDDPVCGWSERIRSYYTGGLIGENIAAGYGAPASVMDAWMNSDGHRANILREGFWEIGVGYYEGGGNYYRYWTQDFGRRAEIYPAIINREAFTTAQREVSLYVYGSDTWDEMRLRNNEDAWDAWRSFTSEISWTLPLIAGEHTVWVELRNDTQTMQSHDEIILQLPPPVLNDLPSGVTFIYQATQNRLFPTSRVITLVNTTSETPIEWVLEASAALEAPQHSGAALALDSSWFTVAPITGTTPGAFVITPTTFSTTHPSIYTGAVTVTTVGSQEVENVPQRIDVTLDVAYPMLGDLPAVISFTYSTQDDKLYPSSYLLNLENVGSNDVLVWSLTSDVHWIAPTLPFTGITPQTVKITPVDFNTSMIAMHNGVITITVVSPTGTLGSPQAIDVILNVVDTSMAATNVFLPLVSHNYVPPVMPRMPNDPGYTYQWALEKINAPLAWGASEGDDVLVAVLDTGAHFAHEDLVGKLRDDIDWDYINGDNTAQDDHGHGTHVAGIIAATPNNSLGVVGLGWNATVVPFKILDQSGSGELSLSVPAIYAATDQGADVINMSLGTDPQNALQCGNFPELVEALRYAYERGVLVVVAAGNSKQDASNVVPANCPYVLTVAATDMDDWPANFAGEAGSNYGSVVDVAAPGKFIYAPWLDPDIPYAYLEGTSMAAPFVSALAALVWAKYPLYAPDQVAAAILDNALDLGGSGWDQDYGCGRIQAADAVITATTGSMSACRPDALAPSGKMSSSSILGQHPPDTDAYVPGRLIVGFRDQSGLGGQSAVGEQDRLALLRNLGVLNVEHRLPNGAMIVQVAEGREWAIAQQLVRENCVAYVHLDYWISAR